MGPSAITTWIRRCGVAEDHPTSVTPPRQHPVRSDSASEHHEVASGLIAELTETAGQVGGVVAVPTT